MTFSIRNKLSVLVQRRLQVERRGAKRVVPTQPTLCLLQAPDENERTLAVVQNLSLKGAGVLADQGYAPGTILHVLLVNAAHTFSVQRELKVVRCYRTANQQCFLAGPFETLLSHEEMVPFVV